MFIEESPLKVCNLPSILRCNRSAFKNKNKNVEIKYDNKEIKTINRLKCILSRKFLPCWKPPF